MSENLSINSNSNYMISSAPPTARPKVQHIVNVLVNYFVRSGDAPYAEEKKGKL